MENNEQAMSGVQTAETEQEMSSLDKAKELFEYEMTDVLLNFRNEVSQLRNDPNAEFLRREYKTPEFDFTAPELTVQKSELSFGSDVQEINVECKSVEGSLVDVQAVKGAAGNVPDAAVSAGFVSEFEAPSPVKVSVSMPQGAPAAFEKVSVQTDKVSVSVPETKITAPGNIAADIEKPQISVGSFETNVKEQLFSKSVPVQLEAVRVTEMPDRKPDTDAFDIPAPSLSKPTVSIDEAKFGEKIVCPEFPEASAEIEYPEMPEKPDFSSYIEDILASVGAEL